MEKHIVPDEELTPEDLEARKKGLALVARIEYLYQTDEGFRREVDEGYEQIETGQGVDVTADILRAENRLLRESLEAIFAHPMLCDVRACRNCGVPVIHMEQFRGKLDEAKAIEAKARDLLGQEKLNDLVD